MDAQRRVADLKAAADAKRVADQKAAADAKRMTNEKAPTNTGIINAYLFIYPSMYFSISFLLYLSV